MNEGEIYFKSTKVLKEVGDLNPHLLLGDVLVIMLYYAGDSHPLIHSLPDLSEPESPSFGRSKSMHGVMFMCCLPTIRIVLPR